MATPTADSYPAADGAVIYAGRAAPGGPSPATSFALSGPSSGTTGAPATFSVTPNGPVSANRTVTLSATSGGVLSVSSLVFLSGSSTAQTFTLTRPTDGSSSVSIASDGGLGVTGSPIAFSSTTSPMATPSGLYQDELPYLLQDVPTTDVVPRISGVVTVDAGSINHYGPTWLYVTKRTKWLWANPGGDYLDSAMAAQGASPWASVATPIQTSGHAPQQHSLNITTALQAIQSGDRWNAYMLRMATGGAARSIASGRHSNPAYRPVINVTYTDTTTGVLAARVTAQLQSSSSTPTTTQETQAVPNGSNNSLILEFDNPTKAVSSATLVLHCTDQTAAGSITDLQVTGIINPPKRNGIQSGGASSGVLDAGLVGQPGIIFLHRYLDGTPQTDFVSTEYINMFDNDFSPEIWGGAVNTAKLPYRNLGKFSNGNIPTPNPPIFSFNLTKVSSTYTGEQFVPLAPGLGALRTHKAASIFADNTVTGSGGVGMCNARMPLPIDRIGLQQHIRVRFYARHRMHNPAGLTPANKYQGWLNQGAGLMRPSDRSGKSGIVPNHDTPSGGFSGSSGGGHGWQMRHTWGVCDADMGGPLEGGKFGLGFHLYDYQGNNPAGYRYADDDQWGWFGGFGGAMESNRWYCIETELYLNTVMAEAPGYVPDGYLRAWVDGRLVYERTGLVFRSLPVVIAPGATPGGASVTPMRELGVRDIMINVFHGGKSWNPDDLTFFYTGLVVADGSFGYIGPMNLS